MPNGPRSHFFGLPMVVFATRAAPATPGPTSRLPLGPEFILPIRRLKARQRPKRRPWGTGPSQGTPRAPKWTPEREMGCRRGDPEPFEKLKSNFCAKPLLCTNSAASDAESVFPRRTKKSWSTRVVFRKSWILDAGGCQSALATTINHLKSAETDRVTRDATRRGMM